MILEKLVPMGHIGARYPLGASDSPNSSSVGLPAWQERDTGACQGCPRPPETQWLWGPQGR